MSLHFGNTCPDIDREIDHLKECFYSTIEYLLEQYNGEELTPQTIKDIASDYKEALYQDTEECFEGVRKTNEEMRSVADYQIGELKRDNEDLKGEVEDLTDTISTKDDEIEALESRIYELSLTQN